MIIESVFLQLQSVAIASPEVAHKASFGLQYPPLAVSPSTDLRASCSEYRHLRFMQVAPNQGVRF